MSEIVANWPRKTRELHNHHMDSTVWNDFAFRDGDVIISTYGKAGTTWTQQIVSQLIFMGDENIPIHEVSPWWDMRVIPPEARAAVAAPTHRRMLKTHLPADALVISPKAKYLYVARDGRDVAWSLYNHHAGFVPHMYEVLNGMPGLVGDPLLPPDPDIRRYFNTWVEEDGKPFWSWWDNVSSWWALRDLPNVRLVHFNDLKADLSGEMRAIADFLDIEIPQELWPTLLEHCTFDYMKANAPRFAPMGGAFWQGGADTFINKGVNGRWRDILTPEDCAAYEQAAVEKLGGACASWLANGQSAA